MSAERAVRHGLRGRIAYRRTGGADWGREHFELLSYPGGKTLRALCEMDDLELIRDVSLSVDEQWRPLDGFSRLLRAGRTAGTCLFFANRSSVQFEGDVEGLGRLSQTYQFDGGLRYLGLHPLTNDALITQLRGFDRPGVYDTINGLTNSKSANGDVGLYAMPTQIDVAYVADEPLQVAAGLFQARRFAVRWSPDWAPADLWVREIDGLFLLLRWSMIPEWFELETFQED